MKNRFYLITLLLASCTFQTNPSSWNDFFTLSDQTIQTVELPSELESFDINEVVEVIDKGFRTHLGYEAAVRGNHASVRILFRLGVSATLITHFEVMSHQEHSGFGVILIQALNSSIVGLEPSLSAIELALQSTAVPSTALTETYGGMVPAIDAMLLHANAQFE